MAEPALMPFCRLVELHTGIHLDASKQYLVESRLAPLAQQQGQSVPGLLQILIRTPVGPLHHRAFEALATHETRFFRLRDWNVLIQATDLSAAALDMARVLNHVLRHLQCPGGVLALGATDSLGGYGALKPVQFGQLCCYTHA